MTTAHRPTFNPAVGRNSTQQSIQVSAKNQNIVPLKFRQTTPQGSADEEARRKLREELFAKEEQAAEERAKQEKRGRGVDIVPPTEAGVDEAKRIKLVPDEIAQLDKDDDDEESSDSDADDRTSADGEADGGGGSGKGAAASDSDDDSDDDDTEELLRQLERIKKERAEEKERLARQKAEEEERIRTEQILTANPLMNAGDAGYSLKKKWYDDVVFKNCAKGEPEVKKRFINDTIRSDFHRKFLAKYVQ